MHDKGLLALFFGFFFTAIIVFAALEYVVTIDHESVHRQIDKYFGCENVSVNINLWDTSTTKCFDENRSVTQEEWALHAYNEVVSYNNTHLVLSIFFCTMLIILFIFMLFVYSNKE